VTSLGTHSDTLTVQATYEAWHWLPISVSHTVDKVNNRYWVEFTPEAGTNALAGTILSATKVTYKRPSGSRAAQD
jgi:hypothetical protein